MADHLRSKIILGFAAIYIIWGSTYLAIRFAIESLPPFLMIGLRFLVAGLIFYGWMRARGVPRPRREHWKPALIIGLLMPAGGTGLVSWGEMTVPSGLTALLVALVPLWIVLADWIRPGGTRPSYMMTWGLLLGFAAVALLINPTGIGGFTDVDLFGAFLIVLATMLWATGSIYSQHAKQPESRLMGAGMQMITGGASLVIISALSGEWVGLDLGAVSFESWIALGYLITIGSVAFVAYVWLLSATSAAKVATYAYVNPIIALGLGVVVAGEELSPWAWGCSAIVVVAVMMVIMAKGQKSQPRAKIARPVSASASGQTAECLKS